MDLELWLNDSFFFFNQELMNFQDPLALFDMRHSLLYIGKNLIAWNGKKLHFNTIFDIYPDF